jgi:hypothetical protein
MRRRLGQNSQHMYQTNTGEPIAPRSRGMSVHGLSKLDTKYLPPDQWHREACFRSSAFRRTYGLRGRAHSHVKDRFLASNCVT